MDSLLDKFGLDVDFYSVLIGWGLVFTRTFVMVFLVPFIGGRGIAGRVRLVTSVVLATYVYYLLSYNTADMIPDERGILIALFFKEIFFGLALGLTTVMLFYAIEAGGRMVDAQRGSSNAQIFLPALGQVSIFGLFQFWLGLSFFVAIDGHVMFLKSFLQSFEQVSIYTLPVIEPGMSPFLKLLIRMSADVVILGTQLAAPVLIAIFLTDLVLGIASKMAPQIPVFELGFMMKGYVGVIMVYLSIGTVLSQMDKFFDLMQSNTLRVIQFFSG